MSFSKHRITFDNNSFKKFLGHCRKNLDMIDKVSGTKINALGLIDINVNVGICGKNMISNEFGKIYCKGDSIPPKQSIKNLTKHQKCPLDTRSYGQLTSSKHLPCSDFCMYFKDNVTDINIIKKQFDESISKF